MKRIICACSIFLSATDMVSAPGSAGTPDGETDSRVSVTGLFHGMWIDRPVDVVREINNKNDRLHERDSLNSLLNRKDVTEAEFAFLKRRAKERQGKGGLRILDLGYFADHGWAESVHAQFADKHPSLSVHIISGFESKYSWDAFQRNKGVRFQQLGGFKIEKVQKELVDWGFGHLHFDYILCRNTLSDAVDPVGTFEQLYNLLATDGVMIFDLFPMRNGRAMKWDRFLSFTQKIKRKGRLCLRSDDYARRLSAFLDRLPVRYTTQWGATSNAPLYLMHKGRNLQDVGLSEAAGGAPESDYETAEGGTDDEKLLDQDKTAPAMPDVFKEITYDDRMAKFFNSSGRMAPQCRYQGLPAGRDHWEHPPHDMLLDFLGVCPRENLREHTLYEWGHGRTTL